jgi:hypothetical protein
MIVQLSLSFAAGVLVGFAVALFLRVRPLVLPQPTITNVVCQTPNVRIEGSAPATHDGLELTRLYSALYDTQQTTIPAKPPTGASMPHTPPTFPITRSLSGGLSGTKDYVVVWAEYTGYSSRQFEYNHCT